VFLKILRAPAGPSPESILPDIRCPIIAIWGQDDPWTPLNTGLHQGDGLTPPSHRCSSALVLP
jgi:pimeloyl-ACP methyl ester carboxylesterase